MLPQAWSVVLDENPALVQSIERAEAHVRAREQAGVDVYPPAPLRYRALDLVRPEGVRIVILGQDPYFNPGEAMGLSFSIPRGITITSSLRNIFKELHSDIGITPASHGDLTSWAKQGVLLLNTLFSVERGTRLSHRYIPGTKQDLGWEALSSAIIRRIGRNSDQPVVFMLWGAPAQARARLVDAQRHLVLQCAHPSGLSAYRGFIGCKHFSQANQFLEGHGIAAVDWRLPEQVCVMRHEVAGPRPILL